MAGPRADTRLTLVAALLLAVAPAAHAAGKSVVVLGISGPRGGHAARLVTRALASRYRIVSRGAFIHAAREQGVSHNQASGRSAAARALRVAAVVSGSITRVGGRWVMRLVVFSGHSGRQVGSATFPLRGTRLDPTTAHRVPSGLARAIGSARAGPPVAGAQARVKRKPRRRHRRRDPIAVRAVPVPPQPVPQPAARGGFDDGTDLGQDQPPPPVAAAPPPVQLPVPAPTETPTDDGVGFETTPEPPPVPARRPRDSLGFEVADSERPGGDQVPSYREKGPHGADEQFRISKKPQGRPEWQKVIELSVGLMAVSRSFDFNDPIYPRKTEDHSNYRSGLVPALMFDTAIYPLAYFHRGPLANLGIVGRYYRVLGLKSQPPAGGEPLRTTLHTFEAGLRYRWNIMGSIGSPTLNAGVEFGRLGFVIWDDQTNFVPLPDIAYMYLKLALVGLEIPFYAANRFCVGATGSFDYLLIFSSGEIENTDSSGYGRSSTGGIDVGLGLFASYRGFFAKINGFYRRIFYDFDNNCYHSGLGCKAAGGALDIYMGGTLLVGYAF